MSPKPPPSAHRVNWFALVLLALFSVFCGLYGADYREAFNRHTADYAQNSIVRLTLFLPDGRQGMCTGFVIAPNRILTAYHCTADEESGSLYSITADEAPTNVIYADAHYDLALLSTVTKRPWLDIRTTDLARGERVIAIGYAGGGVFLTQMSGRAMLSQAHLSDDIAPCDIMNYIGIPGMSGGPVIDEQGRVVSVVSRGITGIACGMSTQLVRAFLYTAR